MHEKSFDSYGSNCPKRLSKFIIEWSGFCLHSEYKIQGLTSKKDSYFASYCLYLLYLTKVLGIDFKSALFILHYQRISWI